MSSTNAKVPFDIVDVDPETNKKLVADFKGEPKKFVLAGPNKYTFPQRYRDEAADYYYFKLRPNDVWINTFPRSGTTVTQELMWLVANNLDFETARKIPLTQRSPFIEGNIQSAPEFMNPIFEQIKGDPQKEELWRRGNENKSKVLDAMEGTRYIKTHLAFSLLPPKLLDTNKVLYVARNPKDVVVSYYHHNKLFKVIGYENDFPTYYDYFEKGLVAWGPYWDHIREAWELRNHPNMLFLFYEDLVKDVRGTIRKVSDFLGKKFTAEQVEKLANHLHIDSFRTNTSINPSETGLPHLRNAKAQGFIRTGEVKSDKKTELTPDLMARADKWIAENIAKIPGFKFPEP